MKTFFKWLLENDSDHQDALLTTGFWGRQGAGAIIIAQDTGRILLPHRSRNVQEPNTWGTWGGAIDSKENPETAAKREVEEEAGYSGNIKMIPLAIFKKDTFKKNTGEKNTGEKNTFKYYNFAAIVDHEFEPKLNWETQGYKWVNFGDWPTPLHPGLKWLLANDSDAIESILAYAKDYGSPKTKN